MTDNWQPGDLALCVDDSDLSASRGLIRKGCLYRVVDVVPPAVWNDGSVDVGLIFEECRHPINALGDFWCGRFHKITPLSDAEREEALRDLKAPVREPVQ